jgi:hypothetical protein
VSKRRYTARFRNGNNLSSGLPELASSLALRPFWAPGARPSPSFRHGFPPIRNSEHLEFDERKKTFFEVGLKSFLAKERLSEKEFSRRPFGHDLTALYEEAVRRGLDLRVAHDVRATIDHANCYHYKFEEKAEGEDDTIYYALRYDAGLKVLTSCGALLKVISAILNEIDPARCRS